MALSNTEENIFCGATIFDSEQIHMTIFVGKIGTISFLNLLPPICVVIAKNWCLFFVAFIKKIKMVKLWRLKKWWIKDILFLTPFRFFKLCSSNGTNGTNVFDISLIHFVIFLSFFFFFEYPAMIFLAQNACDHTHKFYNIRNAVRNAKHNSQTK